MSKRQLFGTDGIRGPANLYPLNPETVVKIGKAIALAFSNQSRAPKVVIGRDSRNSGPILEHALCAGLCAMGADVYLAGIVPTPAVAHLVQALEADAGLVLTASHNPAEDNGIKLFDHQGYKLPDAVEAKIEALIFSDDALDCSDRRPDQIGQTTSIADAAQRYINFAKQTIDQRSLDGLRIVLDCANGAAFELAPVIFKELGAQITCIHTSPDGLNINQNCGATAPQSLQKAVIREHADLGMAFDGDADRLIVVDEKGQVIDGDQLIYLLGRSHHEHHKLTNNTVVITQYSNLALDAALQKQDIRTIRVANGDRYVIEAMRRDNYVVGGEKSGHLILSHYSTTGDGIVAALHLADLLKEKQQPLSSLTDLEFYPQILQNITVSQKPELESINGFSQLRQAIEQDLGQNGRLLVRYSGTQNMCRVMVEGQDQEKIATYCQQVCQLLKQQIGC